MRQKICRKRTRTPEHLQHEIFREKVKIVKDCNHVLPIFLDAAWQNIDEPESINYLYDPSPSPEDILIAKDTLNLLSDEAKIMTKLVLNCPEEFFLQNGRIKRSALRRMCRESLGWNSGKTDAVTFEIKFFLQHALR